MPDPDLLSLCDALVTALTGAGLSPVATYSWQPEPWIELADAALAAPVVWVIDFTDSAETPDRFDIPIDEHGVLLVVQRKIGAAEVLATVVRSMAGLVGAIQRYCRLTAVNEASCVKAERLKARDFEALHAERLFRAEILTTWRRAV